MRVSGVRVVGPLGTHPSAPAQDTGGGRDDEGDNQISFSEYIAGLAKTETRTDPGFHFSQGVVATTKEENRKIIAEIEAVLPTKLKTRSTKDLGGSRS